MTEQEWWAGTDPRLLLEFLRDRASDRKLRLFAAACFRRDWAQLADGRSRQAIVVGEQYADRGATPMELRAASDAAMQAAREISQAGFEPFGPWRSKEEAEECHRRVGCSLASDDTAWGSAMGGTSRRRLDSLEANEEARAEVILLRDIFGNPFRPATLDHAWLAWNNATVPRLAEAIYTDRAFDRLPILADALEDAGCTQPDILAHCRDPGPHVRGCWVVDLLLGKE